MTQTIILILFVIFICAVAYWVYNRYYSKEAKFNRSIEFKDRIPPGEHQFDGLKAVIGGKASKRSYHRRRRKQ